MKDGAPSSIPESEDKSWLAQYYTPEKGDTVIRDVGPTNVPPGEGTGEAATLSSMPVDKYSVEMPCGRGGMKTVFEARDRDASRKVALATLRKDLGKPDTIRRFVHEARITAFLEHPNIVPVHDIGVDPKGRPYYTMKLLEGQTLQAILKKIKGGNKTYRRKYSLPYMLEVFLKICNAVGFAHSRGVVHLDLKPANVQVSGFGEVLVIDWGLAKFLDEPDIMTEEYRELLMERTDLTVMGDVIGTPGYMAPEQARGQSEEKDIRTDIYALGAILYAVLTWVSPGEGDTVRDVLARTKAGRITPPRERAPRRGIPAALEAVVVKAMAFDPDKRYQSVEELSNDILAYGGGFAPAAQDVGLPTLFWLFVKRHKLVASLVIISLTTIAALVTGFVVKVKAGEAEAVANYRKYRREHDRYVAEQERKNEYGRLAAPRVLMRAEKHLKALNIGEALRDFDLATTLDPSLQNAWAAKGMLHLGRLEFDKACRALENVQPPAKPRTKPRSRDKRSDKQKKPVPGRGKGHAEPRAASEGKKPETPLVLAKRYLEQTEGGKSALTTDEVADLIADIVALDRAYMRYRGVTLAALFQALATTRSMDDSIVIAGRGLLVLNPKATAAGLEYEELDAGRLSVKVTGGPALRDLSPLLGLPIERLDMSGTGVTDLKWLRKMPLLRVDISDTPVRDLSPLGATPVQHIRAVGRVAFDPGSLRRLPKLQVIEVDDELAPKAEAALKKLKKAVIVAH